MITAKIAFFVPGIPAPQGSKRHIGRGIMVESSKQLAPWREHIGWAAHDARENVGRIAGPAAIDCEFVLPRPKSTPKTYTPAATKRPDVDKLARAVLDAITGILITDDSHIVDLRATKRLARPGELTGVHIELRALDREGTAA